MKPLESAGSDDVYLCHSPEEVREAFSTIDGKVPKNALLLCSACKYNISLARNNYVELLLRGGVPPR